MPEKSLKERLKCAAQEAGFDSCQVAEAGLAPHAPQFLKWLQDGAAGEMAWLERNPQRRTNPGQVLPECRSVIILATNYWQGDDPGPQERDGVRRGRFARYAWGQDYHDILLKNLQPLDELLRKAGGIQKLYVDTGPVLERDWAARAGVGWHGKSTMLLNETLGTWFFLSSILTTLSLPADPPVRDRCGSCVRCIEACPTGAITRPYRVDSRLCISYLTIELKGSIPMELRTAIGDRVFGCDDCLTACPWNRFASQAREMRFQARPILSRPLRELLHLSRQEFSDAFRKSPVKRLKLPRFRRNVAVALGNTGTRDDLPALERAAADSDPMVAEHAEWALTRIRERYK